MSRITEHINTMKAIAILSVICAHCSGVNEDASIINKSIGCVLANFGTVGVCVFFFLSGLFISNSVVNSDGFGQFVKKKFVRIVPPWLIWGTLVFLYVAIRKGGDFKSWLTFMVGIGSYLYFLTVILFLYIIGYLVAGRNGEKYILNAVLMSGSLIFNVLAEMGIISQGHSALSPLNWYLYFGLGILFKNFKSDIRGLRMIGWVITYLTCFLMLAGFAGYGINYWSVGFVAFGICSVVMVYNWSCFIDKRFGQCIPDKGIQHQNRFGLFVGNVGRNTMFIYLVHMPFAGIITNLCNRVDIWGLTLLRPLIVFCLTWCMLVAIRKMLHILNLERFDRFLGLNI